MRPAVVIITAIAQRDIELFNDSLADEMEGRSTG